MSNLEERVKALEDQWCRLAGAIVAAPAPQPKQNEQKDYFATDQLTVWQQYPETERNAGRWEKNTQTENLQYKEIVAALQSTGKQLHSKDPAALYWLLLDNESGKVTGIGRRRDEWRKK